MLWIVKRNALFHYYQNKRLEIDKIFVREEKEGSVRPQLSSCWPPTMIKLWVVFFFFLIMNSLLTKFYNIYAIIYVQYSPKLSSINIIILSVHCMNNLLVFNNGWIWTLIIFINESRYNHRNTRRLLIQKKNKNKKSYLGGLGTFQIQEIL